MARTLGVRDRSSTDFLTQHTDYPPKARPHDQNSVCSQRVPKERSDLAFASGFLALACVISRFSLIPLIFELKHIDVISDFLFFVALPLPGLPAPFALWTGLRAWKDLTGYPSKSGWLPAIVGSVIGFLGTLILLFETYQVIRVLTAIN
jgi:hypothetical protein